MVFLNEERIVKPRKTKVCLTYPVSDLLSAGDGISHVGVLRLGTILSALALGVEFVERG